MTEGEMVGLLACMEDTKNECHMLVGKTKGKDHLQDLGTIVRMTLSGSDRNKEGVDWIQMAKDRNHWRVQVNAVMNLWVP